MATSFLSPAISAVGEAGVDLSWLVSRPRELYSVVYSIYVSICKIRISATAKPTSNASFALDCIVLYYMRTSTLSLPLTHTHISQNEFPYEVRINIVSFH